METVTVAEGTVAVREHDRLVQALTRHLEYLHGHAVSGMANKKNPTERESATSGLLAALRLDSGTKTPKRATQAECPAARALTEAADAVRLATDVLATHYRPGYGGRTADARLIEDRDAQWGITVRAADLAYTAAVTGSRLVGRLPSGPRAREVGRLTSDVGLVNSACRVLTTAAGTGPGSKAIAELGPFAAPLPRTNPLASAATALQHVRAEVHRLAIEQRLGADSLHQLALLGLSIAQHTDAITRAAAVRTDAFLRRDHSQAAASTLFSAAQEARALARRWRELFGQLEPLRSPDPPQAGLAHAALAVRATLESNTRREGRWATPDEMHPTRRQMEALLTGIRAIALPLDELAATGQHALATLQRRGQLYIHAQALPNDPELLHAQSTGRYVLTPDEVSERLAEAWQEIAERGRDLTPSLAGSAGLVGHHPRHAAAVARTSSAPPGESENKASDGYQHHEGPAPSPGIDTTSPPEIDTRETGEAANIESARQTLRSIADTADRVSSAIDSLSVSLTGANVDTATLGAIAAVLEAADHLKATADSALSGMNHRHAAVEEAVNGHSRSAATRFYRH